MRLAFARAALGIALSVAALTSAFWALEPNDSLLDFGSFLTSGEAYGLGLDPYGVYEDLDGFSTFHVRYRGIDVPSPNLNPPISVYLFQRLASLNPGSAMIALAVMSVVLYAAGALVLLRAYRWQRRPLIVVWLVSLAGLWHTLELGQIYLPLLLPGIAAWLILEKDGDALLAGVLIGLVVAMKPNFAFWPLLLLLAGHRRPAAGALVTALAISALPLALDGTLIYRQWIDALLAFPGLALPVNASVVFTFHHVGVEPIGYAAAGMLLVAAAAFCWRIRPSAAESSALAILAVLVVGPITWSGYTLFALPVLLSRRWGVWEWAAALLLSVPVWLILRLGMLGEPVLLAGGIHGWAPLILLGAVSVELWQRRSASQTSATPAVTSTPMETLRAA